MEPPSSAAAPAAAPPPLRVLRRAVPSPSYPSPSSSTTTPPPQSSTLPDGVVVVGFISRKPSLDASQLANRLLDANVFGSGGLDKCFLDGSESNEWFLKHRRISYFHDREKGLVFVLLSYTADRYSLLAMCRTCSGHDGNSGPVSILEELEAGDLHGMLFMFSVCHVVIFLHDGLRFDTQLLKKFRVLQAAKHSLAPIVRSQIVPILTPKMPSSSSAQQLHASSATSVSPTGRHGSSSGRHSSAVTLMSGTGSLSSVFPGQCVPVLLFVFVDELENAYTTPAPNAEDSADASSVNQLFSSGGMVRPGLNHKHSNSVVVLTRPVNRTEGNSRKKLHSSLETQIRFLIKKCRILVGMESGHLGTRGNGNLSSPALFTLDATRIVALLDRSMNQKSEPLDFISSIIEEKLNSGAFADANVFESHGHVVNSEDTQLIKDFIYRQADTLRGRGGLPSNASPGPITGVGMVAAAAAAAAASASAGKTVSAPQLPSVEKWVSSCTVILRALICFKHDAQNIIGGISRLSLKNSNSDVNMDQNLRSGLGGIEAVCSRLESGMGLNMKFSMSWCQRALPAAKEVYLKDLPACYPTALHTTHMEKALQVFFSMVKGPAVKSFAKMLAEECTSVWESGRQLCDNVSLTGKPCMYKRHDDKTSGLTESKQHSSGYVFLHACACGRSRRLREDPFDFQSANVTFNYFENCESLLPTVTFPKGNDGGSLPSNSWTMVRLGGAKYYKPSKGLLQIGFSSKDKFLHRWTISDMNQKQASSLPVSVSKASDLSSAKGSMVASRRDGAGKKFDSGSTVISTGGFETYRKLSSATFDDSVISFGKGLPSFTMKKPFSEVVAGNMVGHSMGCPHQEMQQAKDDEGKGASQSGLSAESREHAHLVEGPHKYINFGQGSRDKISHASGPDNLTSGDPFLQIGSNIVPVNISIEKKIQKNDFFKQIVVYVGFEHECAHGHRFLLSPEHLKVLRSPYPSSNKYQSPTDGAERKYVETKPAVDEKWPVRTKPAIDEKGQVRTTGRISYTMNSDRPPKSTRKSEENGWYRTIFSSGPEILQDIGKHLVCSNSEEAFVERSSHFTLDDGGPAFTLLNKDLPVYMNCPYCKSSVKDSLVETKFASSISQLQRIFVVTPPFPTILATCPVIQFEDACLPSSINNRELQSTFSPGYSVVLPPESFVTLRLPFVYGVRMDDESLYPLKCLQNEPELTAWLKKGTALQIVSKESVCSGFQNAETFADG